MLCYIKNMSQAALNRITYELTEIGHSLTSYAELGLSIDDAAVAKLGQVVGDDVFGAEAAKLAVGTDKKDLVIAQSDETKALSMEFVRPVIHTLFANSARALGAWAVYGVNRYDKVGGRFEPHMDSAATTVAIVTVCGRRTMDIYRRYSDQNAAKPDTFRDIEYVVELGPGSVMLIDGQLDPPHSVTCTQAPSLSVIVDIPDLLRT